MTRQQWLDKDFQKSYYKKRAKIVLKRYRENYVKKGYDGFPLIVGCKVVPLLSQKEGKAIDDCARRRGIGRGYFAFYGLGDQDETLVQLSGNHKTPNLIE